MLMEIISINLNCFEMTISKDDQILEAIFSYGEISAIAITAPGKGKQYARRPRIRKTTEAHIHHLVPKEKTATEMSVEQLNDFLHKFLTSSPSTPS